MNLSDPSLLQEAQIFKNTQVIHETVNSLPSPKQFFNSPKPNLSTGYAPVVPVVAAPVPHTKPSNHYPYHHVSPPGAPPSRPAGTQRANFVRGSKGSAILNAAAQTSAVPTCSACAQLIRGPFVSAVGKIWCPNHFVCANPACGVSLQDIGFVEENGKLYCEKDFEAYFAPKCYKCSASILGECCYALDKSFHPECFTCGHCKQKIGSGKFHIEDGIPYCERDFSALFSVKCAGCQFPIEAGDKFLEAINQKWHVECFNCSTCNVPLHHTGFATKGNKPYCKKHAY